MDPLPSCIEPQKIKFGEIYCNNMGVLSFHCVFCKITMDHSDDFILHYMIHFIDVFEIKQEKEDIETDVGIYSRVTVEQIFKPEKKKVEEEYNRLIYNDIKLEPQYHDHNYASAYQSFSEEIHTDTFMKEKPNNSEIRTLIREPQVCSICGQQFVRAKAYDRHLLSHGTTRSLYKCDICGVKIKEKKYLKSHMLALHSGLPKIKVPCNICGKVYDPQYLKLHVMRHNILEQKPSHKCSICDKSFLVIQDLSAHIRKHNKKTTPCNVCGKSFSTPRSLAAHLRIHTGERPFLCSICGSRFRNINTFYIHQTIHWTGKNFSCDICDVKFKNPAGVRSHKRKVHGKKITTTKTKCVKEFIPPRPVIKLENLSNSKSKIFVNIKTYSKCDKSKKISNL